MGSETNLQNQTPEYLKGVKHHQETSSMMFDERDSKMRTASTSLAFEIESWTIIQHENYNLHVLKKTPPKTRFRKIPTTLTQRLTYYRSHTCAPFKFHITTIPYIRFGRLVYMYCLGMLFTSWPSNYIHLFLSAYVPEKYLYLAKMVPISCALNCYTMIALYSELLIKSVVVSGYVNFIFKSFIFKSPWKVCEDKVSTVLGQNLTCLELEDFRSEIFSGNVSYFIPLSKMYFYNEYKREYFEIAATQFLRNQFENNRFIFESFGILFVIVIWIYLATSYKVLFWKVYWSIYNGLHWIINIFYMITIVTIFVMDIEETAKNSIKIKKYYEIPTYFDIVKQHSREASFYAVSLADVIVSPIPLHILTARSEDQIHPGQQSALIELSNALYYFLNAVLAFMLERFCIIRFGTVIRATTVRNDNWFGLWIMCFSTFHAGELMCLILFTMLTVMHMSTLMIMYNCFTEVIRCEWPNLRGWMINLFMFVLSLIVIMNSDPEILHFFYIYLRNISTISVIVTVCGLYPLWRLIDDHTFVFGFPPNGLILLGLKLTIVLYVVVSTLNYRFRFHKMFHYIHYPVLAFGAIFVLYCVVRKRMKCQDLLRPTPQWGPQEKIVRELRKRYDSRDYVPSRASRYLSRYLMERRERLYKLDVNYDQRPTVKSYRASLTRSGIASKEVSQWSFNMDVV